jgi:DNA-binding IclR family transcriptional regulator
VLVFLRLRARDGVAEASYEQISAAFGWSRASAIRHLARLQKLGFVRRISDRPTQTNRWALSAPSCNLIPAERGRSAA